MVITGHPDKPGVVPCTLNIIVEDTHDFTEPELVSAVAKAVAMFVPFPWKITPGTNWDTWYSARFRKILKRMKSKDFEKLRNSISGYCHREGKVNLFLMPPIPYTAKPSFLKRAQVSGLVVQESVLPHTRLFGKPLVTANDDVMMSPAKTAVAAAHALQLLRDKIAVERPNEFNMWKNQGYPINLRWGACLETDDVVIHDAGLTEVEPGTITASASWSNPLLR